MPEYNFWCKSCNKNFTVEHSMFEPHPTVCPMCGHNRIGRIFDSQRYVLYKTSGFTQIDKRLDYDPIEEE